MSEPAPSVGVRRSRAQYIPLVAGLALVGFAVWFFAIRETGPRDDHGRLQGDWLIVMPGESSEVSAGRPPSLVRIEGDRWAYVSGGRETSAWKLTLNADAKELDLTKLEADGQPARFTHGAGKGTEVKQLGMYELDGDEFKVVLAPVQEGRRPTLNDTDIPALTLKRVTK